MKQKISCSFFYPEGYCTNHNKVHKRTQFVISMRNLCIRLLFAFFSQSAAILYNPSFAGGIGCGSGGTIDNTCSTQSAARQATNGAGGEH